MISREEAARTARLYAVPLLLLAAGLVYGAVRLSFLCDDAYITFRYVANAHEGHGLVWNLPPFRPVEGYSNFAWALLLWAVWSWFGIEPPSAANPLSIALGLVLFVVLATVALRLRRADGTRVPAVVAYAALLAIVGNRTFLQWLSSGLETSLFNTVTVGWVVLAFRSPARRGSGWLAAWSTLAALAALTRPDGLLLVAVTAAAGVGEGWRRRWHWLRVATGLAPLAAVVVHLLWRHAFYGEWLPNTYYAKVVAAWPEAGMRYFLGFAVEHGVWFWCLLLLVWVAASAGNGAARLGHVVRDQLPAVAAIGAILIQVGYYVFVVGGDHFEYRVFSHLVPLGGLAALAMVTRCSRGTWWPLLAMLGLATAGSAGWVHLAATADQPRTVPFPQPVADRLPAWSRPLARWYDRNQAWLQLQFLCCRCPQHDLTFRAIAALMCERTRLSPAPLDVPVIQTPAAGLPAWCAPDVAVLDLLGLNDWVIARSPHRGAPVPFPDAATWQRAVDEHDRDRDGRLLRADLAELMALVVPAAAVGDAVATAFVLFAAEHDDAMTTAEANAMPAFYERLRFMAHDRTPPPGYVEALAPNVTIESGKLVVRPRAEPLTPERLQQLERDWRDRVRPR